MACPHLRSALLARFHFCAAAQTQAESGGPGLLTTKRPPSILFLVTILGRDAHGNSSIVEFCISPSA
jgi:hypothetical protein